MYAGGQSSYHQQSARWVLGGHLTVLPTRLFQLLLYKKHLPSNGDTH